MQEGPIENLKDILSNQSVKSLTDFIKSRKSNEIGKWYEIGEDIKVIILNQSSYTNEIFENHQKKIDIHITISGEDNIYLGDEKTKVITKEYDHGLDYELFQAKTKTKISNIEGHFVLLEPGEIHSNSLSVNSEKIVVKLSQL